MSTNRPAPPAPPRPMGTIPTVAKYLGMCDEWVRRKVNDGSLRAYRVGANLRIDWDDVQAFLEQNVNTGPYTRKGNRRKRKAEGA